jgi:trimeric autotransporter adhesin
MSQRHYELLVQVRLEIEAQRSKRGETMKPRAYKSAPTLHVRARAAFANHPKVTGVRLIVATVLSLGMFFTGQNAAFATSGNISTVVGGPGLGQGTSVAQCEQSVALDSSGNIYTNDTCLQVVREYLASTGAESVVAGVGEPSQGGYSGDNGPGSSAQLNNPGGLALDASGNLLIPDSGNSRLRVVAGSTAMFYGISMTAGDIYTIAGDGSTGTSGDNGVATSAAITPSAVAVDSSGNLVIADAVNNRIRVVAESTATFYSIAMTSGDIYELAGGGASLGDGGAATSAELNDPIGLAIDSTGNILVGDTGDNRVRVVAEATGTYYNVAMTTGDIYTVAGNGTPGFSGDTGAATSAELHSPEGVTTDSNGNLLVADEGNNRIRVLAASTATFYGVAMTLGDIYTIVGGGSSLGDSGPATSAQLSGPGDMAFDPNGNIVLTDGNDRRVRVVAESSATFYGVAMSSGDIYTIDGTGTIYYSGDSGPATSAELDGAEGIAVDSSGDEFIADSHNFRIRMVPAVSGTYYGISMTAGDIYTVAGNGTDGFSGNTGSALSAEFNDPASVAIDANGNIVVADTNNCEIRVVAASAGTFYGVTMSADDVYAVAGDATCGDSGNTGKAINADIGTVRSVTIDSNGNLVIADTGSSTSTCYIHVVADTTASFYGRSMTKDHIYYVAGDGTCGSTSTGILALSANLNQPDGVAVDANGNLVIADTSANVVQVVAESTATFYGIPMTVKRIYIVAGTGTAGYSGDGGVPTSAKVNSPFGVAVDANDNVIIGDELNDRVRLIAHSAGTYYGVSMTAGDIYTVAGNGTNGFTGDGGSATSAEIYDPLGVAVDSAGLFISDFANDRIREVLA